MIGQRPFARRSVAIARSGNPAPVVTVGPKPPAAPKPAPQPILIIPKRLLDKKLKPDNLVASAAR